ncbi:MAG: hypothetical protein KDD69_20125, partial [Bdellovibrionales bacterium]|nr:hypothetical protein [Bdellovibrionales bacterium]
MPGLPSALVPAGEALQRAVGSFGGHTASTVRLHQAFQLRHHSPISNTSRLFLKPEKDIVLSSPPFILKGTARSLAMLKKITFLNLVTAAWLLFCASASKVSAQTLYFDDQDAGFSTTGSWSYNPSKPGAWNNDHTWSHFDYPGNGDTVGAATWSLGSLVGLYDVKVFFHEHSNRAPDAKYQVTYDSGQNSGDIVVDQRNRSLYSPDFEGFVSLGQYCNPSSVSLSNIVTQGQNPDSTYYGFVVADAVKLERLDDCPPDVPPAPGPVN